MELVVLDVKSSSDDSTLKILWRYQGQDFPAYFVDRKPIINAGNEIRSTLKTLVQDALVHNVMNEIPRCGSILKELAEKGWTLYRRLFLNDVTGIPKKVQDWLKELGQTQQTIQLKVIVDNRIHIPWGLIYDKDPSSLSGNPAETAFELFKNFWCIKLALSCLHKRILPYLNDRKDPNLFRVLPVFNKTCFNEALAHLSEEEKVVATSVLKVFESPVHTKTELLSQWQTIRASLGILFFYCHANQTRLALGQDELDIDEFRTELRHADWSLKGPTSFAFLNGCSTAVGDPGGGFLEATGGPGFCGFIGTETEIPDLFALRFSLAFMYDFFYEGMSVFETIAHLRKQHWPISLLYSNYCDSRLCVEKLGAQQAIADILNRNFSTLPVGSKIY